MSQFKENKKWTREEAEQNKNKLLQELQQEPFNTSGENLEWVTKELNQLIDEEEIRQNTIDYNTVKKSMQSVPFVDEVEVFNKTMGKPNNYTPNIPEEKEWMFVYNFILEELEEYKHACETGNIVEVLDALCDITYVSLGNGAMLHGLKDKVQDAYAEVQASNMSKACKTEEEANLTVRVREQEQGTQCHYEKQGDYWVVYRTHDRKVMKSINYFRPNLKQFLNQ